MEPRPAFEGKDDLQIVDVRWPHEWEAGRIENAVHIPMDELEARFGEIAADRPVLCVCLVGARSELAAQFLRGKGYDAHNLEGGMKAWEREGLPFTGYLAPSQPPQ